MSYLRLCYCDTTHTIFYDHIRIPSPFILFLNSDVDVKHIHIFLYLISILLQNYNHFNSNLNASWKLYEMKLTLKKINKNTNRIPELCPMSVTHPIQQSVCKRFHQFTVSTVYYWYCNHLFWCFLQWWALATGQNTLRINCTSLWKVLELMTPLWSELSSHVLRLVICETNWLDFLRQ